jgi:serine/threonine protein kinase
MPVRLVSQERLPPPLEGYVLLERLGRGGFGEVWKAEAPGGLLKAIKFVFGDLDAQDDENTRAAEQERKALERVKKIRHSYILSLERYDVIDGQLIIVMELADRNLWDRFRDCRGLGMPGIPRDELLKYLEEAAEALDLMNSQYHIQHLDIKPQNLFLIYNHVKVADFGLAKAFEGVRGTVTGGVTPVYAGPETFEGYVSRYTDQYSLAIVFQELLTGTRPFNGANTKQLLMQHLTGTPDISPLPEADQPIVARSLAKKPDQRWPSCGDLIRALRQVGAGAAPYVVAPTPAPGPAAESVIATRVSLSGPSGATAAPESGQNTVAATPPESPVTHGRSVVRQLLPSFAPANPLSPAILNTPLPALVTPRMVTPQSGGSGVPALTLQRPVVVDTAKAGAFGLAAPERTGDGVLMPALVVAVGRSGLLAQQKLRAAIRERFGSLDAAPHVRFLYIDSDPESTAAAMSAAGDPTPAKEVVLTRLNRAHHYLQREGMPSVEQWMPTGLLYKLPRNPGPAGGVRAFGRLALADNYRAVVQRIRQELDAFVTDEAIEKAAAATGLGVRANRARVYLLAGLAGGTGGGMFIDLAYILKHELRQIGYLKPEAVGILFVTPADKTAPRGTALSNTFAALAELAHFHDGRNRYQVRFDTKEPAIADVDGPFNRCAMVQLSRRGEPKDQARTAGLAARSIFLDLFTPTGRTLDSVRSEAAGLNRDGVPVVQAFGLYRLSWPRPEILALATRRFVQRLIERWTTKDSAHLREPILAWLDEQWRVRGLELEAVVARFEAVARETLREDPERVFDALLEPLRTRTPGPGGEADTAAIILEQVVELVGKPDAESERTGTLAEGLAGRFRQIVSEMEKHLASLSVYFVEKPGYRLAGAEETLVQIEARLRRTEEGLAGVRGSLIREVNESFVRAYTGITGMGSMIGRRGGVVDVTEQIRTYARKRLKLLVLNSTLAVYRGMLRSIPDFIREVGYCRAGLVETAHSVGQGPTAAEGAGPGRMILPHGVEGLDGAADWFLGLLPPEDTSAFDQKVQQEIEKKFKALVAVCNKPEHANQLKSLLVGRANEFLDTKLEMVDPAVVFFRYRDDGPSGTKMVMQAYEGASPDLTGLSGKSQLEATILACPAGPEGARFRRLVEATVPGVQLIPASLPDDITFFREYPLLPLTDLPQLGPHARSAYDAAAQTDQSPHSRGDVAWVAPS